MADTSSLALSGLASGVDWRSLIDQLIQVDRAPESRMRSDQSTNQQKNDAFGSIKTQLSVLQKKVQALSDPTLFDSRLATSSDTSIATVTSSGSTPEGTYEFQFQQLATV